jgi:hypothetical protein
MPTKDCSDVLLNHGSTWTSWIHFAVHLQTFELEHESAWSNGNFLGGDTLWLAVYFGFIAVSSRFYPAVSKEANVSKMSLMFMDEDEAMRAGLPLSSIYHCFHSRPFNLTGSR